MWRAARVLIALIGCLTVSCAEARAAEPVDLLLVLAADTSGSVDHSKFRLQREGYAAAISSPRVLDAIKSGPHRRIAVCFVEWSGAQKLVIDWTLIGDADTARRFASQMLEATRSFTDSTSISGAIDFAMDQLDRVPYQAERRIIDMSGDGDNNAGRDVTAARDAAVAKGVTINGLVIPSQTPQSEITDHTDPPGGLVKYYRDHVIGGPGAFVMVAENPDSFAQAIMRKLIAEIAIIPP